MESKSRWKEKIIENKQSKFSYSGFSYGSTKVDSRSNSFFKTNSLNDKLVEKNKPSLSNLKSELEYAKTQQKKASKASNMSEYDAWGEYADSLRDAIDLGFYKNQN